MFRGAAFRLAALGLVGALFFHANPCTCFAPHLRTLAPRLPATARGPERAWTLARLSGAKESTGVKLWASVPEKNVVRSGAASGKADGEKETVDAGLGIAPQYREALTKTAISIAMAIAFGAGVWTFKGADSGIEYYAGYLVEQSLSVDNLFVFVVLFEYFKVPTEYQDRVLTWGIIGAMVMRAIMVLAGVEALEHFKGILLVFAGVLVFSSAKLLTEGAEDEGEDEDLSENGIISVARKMVSAVDYYDGSNFFTYVNGAKLATPMLLVLICIELSDVVFAIDSVPAVFGVTKDPFIVYTSNIFAILGLRSLFTVLANAMVDLPYLKPAVALILGFVGAKLGAEYFGYEVPNTVSLGVIVSMLGGGIGASLKARDKL